MSMIVVAVAIAAVIYLAAAVSAEPDWPTSRLETPPAPMHAIIAAAANTGQH